MNTQVRETAPAVSRAQIPLRTLAGLLGVLIMSSLDQNIVNTALPRMVRELGGAAIFAWTVTAFMLASSCVTLVYGRLSDIYGRRRLFYWAIGLFLLGSALCGLAPNMGTLIAFRFLQGLGAGGLMTLASAVVADLVPPSERGRYQGLFTGAYAVASLLGPALGGVITEHLSWRFIFYLNIPVGGLALGLLHGGLPRSRAGQSHPFDYVGTVLLGGSTAFLLLSFSLGGVTWAFLSWQSAGLLLLSGIGFFVIAQRGKRVAQPILRLDLMLNPSFARLCGVMAGLGVVILATMITLQLYLQGVRGLTPSQSGLAILPQVGALVVSSFAGGRLSAKIGRYKPLLLCGIGCEIFGFLWLAWNIAHGLPLWEISLSIASLGLGMGVAMPHASILMQNVVAKGDLGVATATGMFVRSAGSALGITIAGALIHAGAGASSARNVPVNVSVVASLYVCGALILLIVWFLALSLREAGSKRA